MFSLAPSALRSVGTDHREVTSFGGKTPQATFYSSSGGDQFWRIYIYFIFRVKDNSNLFFPILQTLLQTGHHQTRTDL